LVRNGDENIEGTTLTDTNRKVDIVVDKGDAGDLTRTKGGKRKMSDRGKADTWTRKKSKVSFLMRIIASLTIDISVKGMDFRIKLHVGKKRSTVKISVKIS
jgi:hypothetical protein